MARFFYFCIGIGSFGLAGFFGLATAIDLSRPTAGFLNVLLFMTFSIVFMLNMIGYSLLDIEDQIVKARKAQTENTTRSPP